MIESIATILNDRQDPLNTMEIDYEHQNLGRLSTPVCTDLKINMEYFFRQRIYLHTNFEN